MLKKRLVGVVVVKRGWAVQSFGYHRYLPLGKPECVVENLDRWGADEILVLNIDRSINDLGPDLGLLERLAQLGLRTPLIYGGGIRTVMDGLQVIRLGADRLCIDTLMHDDTHSVRELSERLGAQAVIAAMPLSWSNEHLQWLDYRSQLSCPIPDTVLDLMADCISEAMIIDWQHEGQSNGFDYKLIKYFPLADFQLIAFGGLSETRQLNELFMIPKIAAVAIGNFLSYKEHAIQSFKERLVGLPIRPANYSSKYAMPADA